MRRVTNSSWWEGVRGAAAALVFCGISATAQAGVVLDSNSDGATTPHDNEISFTGAFNGATGVGTRPFGTDQGSGFENIGSVEGSLEWFDDADPVAGGSQGGYFTWLAKNTSHDAGGQLKITGFAFQLPSGYSSTVVAGMGMDPDAVTVTDGTNSWDLGVFYVAVDSSVAGSEVSGCNFRPGGLAASPADCAVTQAYPAFLEAGGVNNIGQGISIDFGAALGGDFLGGGTPNTGILPGQVGAFIIKFAGTAAMVEKVGTGIGTPLETGDFQDDSQDGIFWCVRWRGQDGEPGSDKACGNADEGTVVTPEPATVALLALGLLGLGVAGRARQGRIR